MFEITGSDIADLSDEDLRTLVARLCESELKHQGLSTSAVTWGGNQNAADGGIDVRVEVKAGTVQVGFVPNVNTGYQVKKTDFTPGLISPEMRPSGQLRGSIKRLIEQGRAYIIVSSGSDTSDSARNDRLSAMRDAVSDHAGHERLHLDFYDRSRLATWTRNHPGMVAWVRRQTGRAIPGWQPYSSWAASPDGVQDEYLFDENCKLHAGIGNEAIHTAILLCERINDDLSNREFRAHNLEELLKSIFSSQPRVALSAFFDGDITGKHGSVSDIDFDNDSRHRKHPIDQVPTAVLLEWCDEKPGERYPVAAHAISFGASTDKGAAWTPLAIEMLGRSPDPLAILNIFIKRFTPRGWSGSLASILESRLTLLDRLSELNTSSLSLRIARARSELAEQIVERRKYEEERDRYQDDRFE